MKFKEFLQEQHKLLNSDKLSSEEYQKAKKLKGFSKDNYKWDADEQLYVKLDESKPSDIGSFLYGQDGTLSKLKRFFTGNWIEPMNGSAKTGERTLKKAGLNDKEIQEVRDAVYIAMGEALDKFGDPSLATKDDTNFSGWRISVSHSAAGGTFADKKVKDYIIKRVNELLKDKK